MVAADTDPERGLDDTLDLLVEEVASTVVEAVGLAQALALGEPADLDPGLQRGHDDQPPRLHEPDGRRAVGGLEHAPQDVGRDVVGAEAADVAAVGDDAMHRRARVVVVAPALRVRRALGGARGVEARGRRRADEAIRGGHACKRRAGVPKWSGDAAQVVPAV